MYRNYLSSDTSTLLFALGVKSVYVHYKNLSTAGHKLPFALPSLVVNVSCTRFKTDLSALHSRSDDSHTKWRLFLYTVFTDWSS